MNVEAFDGEFPEPAINEDNKIRWTGKQVFSMILPPISIRKGGGEKIHHIRRHRHGYGFHRGKYLTDSR